MKTTEEKEPMKDREETTEKKAGRVRRSKQYRKQEQEARWEAFFSFKADVSAADVHVCDYVESLVGDPDVLSKHLSASQIAVLEELHFQALRNLSKAKVMAGKRDILQRIQEGVPVDPKTL